MVNIFKIFTIFTKRQQPSVRSDNITVCSKLLVQVVDIEFIKLNISTSLNSFSFKVQFLTLLFF